MIETRFKKTIYGTIPQDWLYCAFGDVLQTFSSGATPYRGIPDYYKGNIRWISSGELNYNRIFETIEHISEDAKANTHLKLHSEGTFLMAITGLEAAGTRGRCAIVGAPSTTNQSCLAINGTDKMSVDFLFWFYCYWGDFLAFKYCQGSKQQSYTASIVKKLPIYLPPTIGEQNKIVSSLSDIDALLSTLNKKIAKKKLIKQGAMQQLFTGKKRLAGFTEPWVKKELGEVAETSSGGTPNRSQTSYYNGKIRWFTTGELNDCFLNDSIEHITETGLKNSSAKIFNKGTLLMAMYGATIGKLGILNYASATNQACCAIMSNLNILFLFYRLLYDRDDIVEKGCGAGQPNISQSIIKKIVIKIPPTLAEQTAIATILSDMDKEIEGLVAKRAKYEQVKQGMMQQLLTGKIRFID